MCGSRFAGRRARQAGPAVDLPDYPGTPPVNVPPVDLPDYPGTPPVNVPPVQLPDVPGTPPVGTPPVDLPHVPAVPGCAVPDVKSSRDAADRRLDGLAVMSREVGQSGDGWLASDGGVGSVMIVEVEPARQGGIAFFG